MQRPRRHRTEPRATELLPVAWVQAGGPAEAPVPALLLYEVT
jgi:hypothetical protein